ncbi:MAG: lysine--tRNA ligase [Candidatus Adiutrix sp.]
MSDNKNIQHQSDEGDKPSHAPENPPEALSHHQNDDEQSPVIKARFDKAHELSAEGQNLYPNTFRPSHKALDIKQRFQDCAHDDFDTITDIFVLAGRIMARRDYGKSVFFDLADPSGRIQIYLRKQSVDEATYELFKKLDIGDIVGVCGRVFKTKTGEITILAEKLELVTKGLWPLPEKYHDMNTEMRYRQRYVDLIMNEESRRKFLLRSKVVAAIRDFMVAHDFIEVETPMMHATPGGATAKPFETYHNALDRKLYLRIAPELYLKRLLVGGFDRVFEINRSFRNEGLSVQHNPEFTMMEFYQSYADFTDLMDFTEEMFVSVALKTVGTTTINYQGTEVELKGPWPRLQFRQSLITLGGAPPEAMTDHETALKFLRSLGGEKAAHDTLGKIQAKIFDLAVEPKLINPTFITHYPKDISPLARRNEQDPTLTDRFELFITGRELANAFSELNDPLDQRERFLAQMAEKVAGDEESMTLDDDYVRALMYGMPPAAGEGIGIDRLVMLLADVPSIKDVILFPHMRSLNR